MKKHLLNKLLNASILIIFFSCNPTKRSWEKAMEQNTVTSYKEFLKKFPKSEFAGEAALRYDSLDWGQSFVTVDSVKMSQYIENHPTGNYVEKAKFILDSLQWEKAISLRDTARIRALISKNPECAFRGKGEAVIWEMEWPPVRFAGKGSVVIYSTDLGGLGLISGTMFRSSPFFGSMLQVTGARDVMGKVLTGKGIRKFCDQYPIPGQPSIFIWRGFTGSEADFAQKLGIRKGVAYLIECSSKFIPIREVDLKKSDDQLCAEFGIKIRNSH